MTVRHPQLRLALAGIVLLGALFMSAALSQSASAAWTKAKNLTAFTCVKGGGALDFGDAHCDEPVAAGTGGWGHVAIPVGETTEGETVNTTPAVLKTTILGAAVELQCAEGHATGTFKNEEPEPGVHTGSGEGTTTFSKCTITKPAGCVVKGGSIALKPTIGIPVEMGEQMGAEILPKEGTTFATVVVNNCSIAGTYPIKGSAVAVGGAGATAKGTGSTAVYLPENENLTFGSAPASVTVTTTALTTGGTAVSGTTVT